MALFTVENVEFESRTAQIVKGVSLSIEKGSTTILSGRSGGGKSTLLKMIAGILVPTSGRVLFEGKDIQNMSKEANLAFRRRCSFVFQDSALWANQNIIQNLTLPLQIHFPKMKQEERVKLVHEVCSKVGYDRDLTLRPVDLSTGEQKKIAFARAIICDPEVLFLDECTESLDKKGSEIIIRLLHDFIDKGNTIIYISHHSSFVNEFPGINYYIDNGVLTGEGNKNEVQD